MKTTKKSERTGSMAQSSKQCGRTSISTSSAEQLKVTWSVARSLDSSSSILVESQKKATEAMRLQSERGIQNPWKNRMRIDIEWDGRKKKDGFQATIRSDNGLNRAEVFKTRDGKARTYEGAFNQESDRDGLNEEGRLQLNKALHVARQIVTGKEKYTIADGSSSESESETSDEDI